MRALSIGLALIALLGKTRSDEVRTANAAPPPIAASCRQLLLVRSASWWAAGGTLERYDRDGSGHWSRFGPVVPVRLGRNGMGWGRGLHEGQETGPLKKEGDGRSPAGVFPLGAAFGAAEGLPKGANDFPYSRATPSSYCVEDVRSARYNQIIDASVPARGSWERWSELRRADGLFDWAIIVRQNEPNIRKGAGSCVFLHIWRTPQSPTAGCTAMPREQVETTLRWLDADSKPLLVQLPEPVFQKLRSAWGLP